MMENEKVKKLLSVIIDLDEAVDIIQASVVNLMKRFNLSHDESKEIAGLFEAKFQVINRTIGKKKESLDTLSSNLWGQLNIFFQTMIRLWTTRWARKQFKGSTKELILQEIYCCLILLL